MINVIFPINCSYWWQITPVPLLLTLISKDHMILALCIAHLDFIPVAYYSLWVPSTLAWNSVLELLQNLLFWPAISVFACQGMIWKIVEIKNAGYKLILGVYSEPVGLEKSYKWYDSCCGRHYTATFMCTGLAVGLIWVVIPALWLTVILGKWLKHFSSVSWSLYVAIITILTAVGWVMKIK